VRGLAGKNVLVTGGASGIGQATAARFLEEGCVVCVVDRSADAGCGNGEAQESYDVVILNGRVLDPETSFDQIKSAGVKFYRYQDGFLHQKVVLIDDTFGGAHPVSRWRRST